MAVEVGAAYVTIIPEVQGMQNTLRKTFGDSSYGKQLGGGLLGGLSSLSVAMGNILSGIVMNVVSTVSSSIDAAIARTDTLNNYPRVMQNLGYSAEEASASVEAMADAARGLPTSLGDLTTMTQQLAPLTDSLDEATQISIAMNNAMLAGGQGAEAVSRGMQQYSQMLSKGKPELQDWKTLMEVMPGQLNQIAQEMLGADASAMDLYEALRDGTVTMDDFNAAVIKLNEEGGENFASFEQQARDATGGIGTAITNIPNRIADALSKIIQALGAEDIAAAINGFSSSFSGIADVAVQGIENLKTYAGELFDALNSNGALDTFNDLLDDLSELASDAGDALGDFLGALVPPPANVAAGLRTIADALSTVRDGLMWIADHAAGVTAALGGIATAVTVAAVAFNAAAIGSALFYAQTAIGVVALDALAAAQAALNFVMSLNPFVLLAAAIAGVIAVLVILYNNSEEFRAKVQEMVANFKQWCNDVQQAIVAFANGAWALLEEWFAHMGQGFTEAWRNVGQIVNSALDVIRGAIASKLISTGPTISRVFNNIRSTIQNAMNGAKTAVQNAINTIKSVLSGTIKFPDIRVPRINVDGGEAPYGIGGAGRTPSISVSWYAKGGIIDGATLVGVGEAGPEMILPQSGGIMDDFADAVTRRDGALVVEWLDKNLGRTINDYAPTATPREFGRMVRAVV